MTTLGGLVPGACPPVHVHVRLQTFSGMPIPRQLYRVLIWVCHESSFVGQVPEHICNNIIYNLAISLARVSSLTHLLSRNTKCACRCARTCGDR